MTSLLEVRGLTVELPTPTGWVRPVNEVSLCINAGESVGLAPRKKFFASPKIPTRANSSPPSPSFRAPERFFSARFFPAFAP